jgi:hypothetical protein
MIYPVMNPTDMREPIFPLQGGLPLPRPLRAPRLVARPVPRAIDERIFPGAWSRQRLQAIRSSPAVMNFPVALHP